MKDLSSLPLEMWLTVFNYIIRPWPTSAPCVSKEWYSLFQHPQFETQRIIAQRAKQLLALSNWHLPTDQLRGSWVKPSVLNMLGEQRAETEVDLYTRLETLNKKMLGNFHCYFDTGTLQDLFSIEKKLNQMVKTEGDPPLIQKFREAIDAVIHFETHNPIHDKLTLIFSEPYGTRVIDYLIQYYPDQFNVDKIAAPLDDNYCWDYCFINDLLCIDAGNIIHHLVEKELFDPEWTDCNYNDLIYLSYCDHKPKTLVVLVSHLKQQDPNYTFPVTGLGSDWEIQSKDYLSCIQALIQYDCVSKDQAIAFLANNHELYITLCDQLKSLATFAPTDKDMSSTDTDTDTDTDVGTNISIKETCSQ